MNNNVNPLGAIAINANTPAERLARLTRENHVRSGPMRQRSHTRTVKSAERAARIAALQLQINSLLAENEADIQTEFNYYEPLNDYQRYGSQESLLRETHPPGSQSRSNINRSIQEKQNRINRKMKNAGFLARHSIASNNGLQLWARREVNAENSLNTARQRLAVPGANQRVAYSHITSKQMENLLGGGKHSRKTRRYRR